MKSTLLISLLLSFASIASAAPVEWTTVPQTLKGKIGTCKLTINSVSIVNAKSNEQNLVISKMNELLGASIQSTYQTYQDSATSSPELCQRSRGQGSIEVNLETKLVFKDVAFSSWEESRAGYLGGAHGYAAMDRIVIDANGNAVPFDFVLATSRNQFITTVAEKVRAAGKFDMSFFTMWADNPAAIEDLNYYADQNGISIFFNSYEINPYSEGPTEITYTWAELKPLLRRHSVFAAYLK